MWQRFTAYDVRVIAHYLGDLILFSSFGLLIPFVVALIFGEWEPSSRYLFAIGVSLLIGGVLCTFRKTAGQLNRQQALAVTGFAWIALALIGAIPLFGSGHYGSYLDALFDSVSGYTSTGACVIADLNHLSNADNMWRFVMHFFGGLGLVVVVLSFGMFGRGASSMYSTEGRSEHVLPNIEQTTRLIAKISMLMIAVFTVILSGFCLASGMEPARAVLHGLWLAITGFITGGFAPTDSSVFYYHSLPMEIVLMCLMLLGGVNFGLYAAAWKGRIRDVMRDTELRTMGAWVLLLVAVTTFALASTSSFSNSPDIMRRGLFMVIAAASTTGLQTVTTNELSTVFTSGAFLMLAIAMSVGLCAGSTTGGIKVNRLSIIVKSIMGTLKQTASADSVKVVSTYYHLGRRIVDEPLVKEAMTIFALFVVVYMLGTLAGIAYGYEATSAIFDSVAMASNGGLTSGIVASDMPAPLEFLYIIEMWVGRLELVTILALAIKIVISLKPRRKEV